MRHIALFALAGALALSACGKKEEEEAPMTNNLVEPPADLEPINEATPPPPPAENVAIPAPPPQVSEDQQTIDDADATGLTARLPSADEVPTDEPSGQVGSGE
ncbi:hypothetical protein WG908_14000 [Sphingobium sp. AN641]|uniref:hypothetical protein n=1 Tax=Sphingobium sp. AN641 TaxID=3133443 RepID=UPI0030C58621